MLTLSPGLYNCGYYGGAIPAAAVTFGCNFLQSNWSWRVPLILQAFACTIVILFVFTIPESPRWLMANGREEEAIEYLIKYHAAGDRNSKLVQLEVSEFRQHIAQNGADKRWWDCESG
jgi:MFS family permease